MHGGYAEYALVGERSSVKLPVALSLADGALIEPLAVGLHAVDLARLTSDARVLVLGAGPMALAAIFWARRQGVGRIAVTARTSRRATLAMQVGGDAFVPQSGDLAGTVAEVLRGPPDVVFECVGVPGLLAQAVDCVGPRGTVVVMGVCMVPDTLTPAVGTGKEVRIQHVMAYGVEDFRRVADALDAGAAEPRGMVTDTVSLDALPTVFESRRRYTNQCKVLVDPWQG